jgi:hypothetical protein
VNEIFPKKTKKLFFRIDCNVDEIKARIIKATAPNPLRAFAGYSTLTYLIET